MYLRRRFRYFGRGVAAAFLALGAPAAAQTAKCDYSGFEKPCTVQEGEYRVLMPEGEGPFPAMVYLYGSGGRSVTIANHPIFEAAVAGRGYALIVPSANEMTYEGGIIDTGWSLASEPERPRDEVAFLRRVIDDAARRFDLDRERILLAGQSRGGFLIWEIACGESGLAAAYAVHAAGYLGDLPEACAEPVRFLQTHGITDTVVPLAGEEGEVAWQTINPLDESLALIARANSCAESGDGEPETFLGYTRHRWPDCAPGSRLDLMLHPGGHGMPASWFRAVLDWFEEPLPEAPEIAPVKRRIGAGLPGAKSAASTAASGEAAGSGRFKAPPAPGEKVLGGN